MDDRRVLFAEFARDWVTSYQGEGGSGFRENTRAEYRRDLERYAIAFLGPRQRVAEITPRHMARFVAWLCDDAAQRRRHAEETPRRVRDRERPAPSPSAAVRPDPRPRSRRSRAHSGTRSWRS